jgi:hypothetical protein
MNPLSESSQVKKPHREKIAIGWSEYVDFPDWEVRGLKAKVDTGARTSALHVENLKREDGDWVTFEVILNRNKLHKHVKVRARVSKWAKVRSSNGEYKLRCFVKTRIRLGPVEKEIEVTLVSRQKMVFRMLIGRKALEKDFIVDVSRRHALGEKPRKKKKVAQP